MPEERAIENGLLGLTSEDIEKYSDDELIARYVELADRSVVDIRTSVPLPPDVWGEWVSNTPEAIAAASMSGFKVDDKYASNLALHSNAKGEPIIGDVIFMTCPMRLHVAMEKASRIRFNQVHGKATGMQEEKDFEGSIRSTGLSTKYRGANINTSINERVSAGQISAAIMASSEN